MIKNFYDHAKVTFSIVIVKVGECCKHEEYCPYAGEQSRKENHDKAPRQGKERGRPNSGG